MNKQKITTISVVVLVILVSILLFRGGAAEKSFATLGDAFDSGLELKCDAESAQSGQPMTYYISNGNVRIDSEADGTKAHMLFIPAGFYMIDTESGEIGLYHEPGLDAEAVIEPFLSTSFTENVRCFEQSISDSLFEVPHQ